MARTFISQPTQVFSSETYDDAKTVGPGLQTGSTSLEDDLNSLRTQVRQVLWAGVAGSWYDAVSAPSGSGSGRGLNTINYDLTDLEQKRFLFRRQVINNLDITTGSSVALLSTSLGTAPQSPAVVYHPLLPSSIASGTIVALLSGTEGTYGTAGLALVSGSTSITPKNLCVIRDAYTHNILTTSLGGGQQIYGLLQAESGTITGDTFNDTNRRTQISFVYEAFFNGTSSFALAPASDIGGRTVRYSYVSRTAFDDIPEDAYLTDNIFVDAPNPVSGNQVVLTDITLDRAIDNQVGTVTMDQDIAIRIAAGFSWSFLSGSKELWKLSSSNTEDSLVVAVDRLAFSSSYVATFQQGVSVSTGSSQIDVGVIAGTINTLTGTSLVLSGGNLLKFSDNFGPNSTYTGGAIPFATSTIEWNYFTTDWGSSTSILGALHTISQSLSGALRRRRYNAGVTPATGVIADANVTFPVNLDSALGDYSTRIFTENVEVYLNGVLLLPGTSSLNPNDVYPGTSQATGDLKFPHRVRSGSIVTMVIY